MNNNMNNRYGIRRVGKKLSPYVEPHLIQKFADETLRSIQAPYVEQCVELELMYMNSDDDDQRCLENFVRRKMNS